MPEHGFACSGWSEEGSQDATDPNPLLKSSLLPFASALEIIEAKQNQITASPLPLLLLGGELRCCWRPELVGRGNPSLAL